MTATAVLSAPDVGPTTLTRRRRDTRYPCSLKGQCRPSGHAFSTGVWPVNVRDISVSGIALVLSRRFEPGTILVVELLDQKEQVSQIFLVRVARVEQLADRAWLLGCTLARRLDENELKALVRFPLAA